MAHCGDLIWTLTSVEISSGWTELRAVWNRGQQASLEGLESIWESQPFDLLGVDGDNGGEFLNFHLYHWLKKHGIHQTRSRPYYKNDQAYVEQKNHTHVRQFLGYERLEHRELLDGPVRPEKRNPPPRRPPVESSGKALRASGPRGPCPCGHSSATPRTTRKGKQITRNQAAMVPQL